MKIPLAKPYIPNIISKKTKALIKTGFLTEGRFTKEFEKYVKEFIDVNIVLLLPLQQRHLSQLLDALTSKQMMRLLHLIFLILLLSLQFTEWN